jgi:hypothetical protein
MIGSIKAGGQYSYPLLLLQGLGKWDNSSMAGKPPTTGNGIPRYGMKFEVVPFSQAMSPYPFLGYGKKRMGVLYQANAPEGLFGPG